MTVDESIAHVRARQASGAASTYEGVLADEVERLRALFQQTHGCDVSWVAEVQRQRVELNQTVAAANAACVPYAAQIARVKAIIPLLEASAEAHKFEGYGEACDDCADMIEQALQGPA